MGLAPDASSSWGYLGMTLGLLAPQITVLSMKYAIIGAGISGATLAHALHQQGHDVTVFDKGRGAGGRMSSRRTEHGAVDHGAQYFTAQSPEFMDTIRQWIQAGWVQQWGDQVVASEGSSRRLSTSVQRFIGVPQMPGPIKGLLSQVTTHTQHTIQRARRQDQAWWLDAAEAAQPLGPFDAVVSSVPLPQLPPLFADLPQPWLAQWSGISMTPCWALMVDWGHRAPADAFDGWFVNDPFVDWIAQNHRKPGRITQPHWTIHATPAWSQVHEEAAPEAVIEHARQWLSDRGFGAPAQIHAHRWRYARSEGEAAQAAYWDADLRIGVIGDWLGGGRVEGAWTSARALLRHL